MCRAYHSFHDQADGTLKPSRMLLVPVCACPLATSRCSMQCRSLNSPLQPPDRALGLGDPDRATLYKPANGAVTTNKSASPWASKGAYLVLPDGHLSHPARNFGADSSVVPNNPQRTKWPTVWTFSFSSARASRRCNTHNLGWNIRETEHFS